MGITTGREKIPVEKRVALAAKNGIHLDAVRDAMGPSSPDADVLASLHTRTEWDVIESKPLEPRCGPGSSVS